MYIGLHVKCRLLLADCNENWIYLANFRKTPQISNFMNIRPVEAELFFSDGQTDGRDEANSRFSQLRERSQKVLEISSYLLIITHPMW